MKPVPPGDWPAIYLGIALNIVAISYLAHELYLSWRNARLDEGNTREMK